MLWVKKRKRRKNPGRELHLLSLGGSGLHRSFRAAAPRRRWLTIGVAALLWFLSGPAPLAKEKKVSRVVTGVVLDEDENGIVGATVELKDLQSGRKVAQVTQEGGKYQFSDLRPNHDYQVQAKYKGTSSEVRTVSSFDARNRIVLNLKIPPAKP